MIYKGTVRNGVVVLPPDVHLPEGAELMVEAVLLTPETDSLVAAFTELAKPRPHWPKDYGENLDHYLYGTPKRL